MKKYLYLRKVFSNFTSEESIFRLTFNAIRVNIPHVLKSSKQFSNIGALSLIVKPRLDTLCDCKQMIICKPVDFVVVVSQNCSFAGIFAYGSGNIYSIINC